MLRLFYRAFGVVVFIGAGLMATRIQADPALALSTDNISSTIEKHAFTLINQYRKENSLPPLAWNSAVAELAREHSRDMATGAVDFGHEGFSARMSELRKSLTGMSAGGENVFMTDMGGDVAETAVAVWLKSPPHLHNIRGDFSQSGIGIWEGKEGAIYFTQIFVKVRPPVAETETESPPGAPGLFFAVPMPTR